MEEKIGFRLLFLRSKRLRANQFMHKSNRNYDPFVVIIVVLYYSNWIIVSAFYSPMKWYGFHTLIIFTLFRNFKIGCFQMHRLFQFGCDFKCSFHFKRSTDLVFYDYFLMKFALDSAQVHSLQVLSPFLATFCWTIFFFHKSSVENQTQKISCIKRWFISKINANLSIKMSKSAPWKVLRREKKTTIELFV